MVAFLSPSAEAEVDVALRDYSPEEHGIESAL
jgi:hypothetical protein